MTKIGYTHGRFQPFHKGHLPILLYILDRYDELWIGISNPLRALPHNFETYDEELKASIAKARLETKNIFTFLEREQMILETLKEERIDLNRVKIYPHFGYYEEDHWADFFPPKDKTTIILHCKDPHHDKKIDHYKKLGWKIEIIPLLKAGYSGTLFYQEYPNGNWRDLVPDGTKKIIENKLKTYVN